MKKLLVLGVVSLFIGIATTTLSGSQDRDVNDVIQDRFVGAWRLAWLEEEGADGKIHRADCTGLLVYTRDSPHVPTIFIFLDLQAKRKIGVVHKKVHNFRSGSKADAGIVMTMLEPTRFCITP
jgi:hypothetical protein